MIIMELVEPWQFVGAKIVYLDNQTLNFSHNEYTGALDQIELAYP